MHDKNDKKKAFVLVLKDLVISLLVLAAAILAGYAFKAIHLADADIIMLYIIAVTSFDIRCILCK